MSLPMCGKKGNRDSDKLLCNIEENIEDIVDGSHKFLANLVAKISFWVDMAKVSKERVCSNYFDINVHKHEILN